MKKYEYKDLIKKAKKTALHNFKRYLVKNEFHQVVGILDLVDDIKTKAVQEDYFLPDFRVKFFDKNMKPSYNITRVHSCDYKPKFNTICRFLSHEYLMFNNNTYHFSGGFKEKSFLLDKLSEYNKMFHDGIEKLFDEDAIKKLVKGGTFTYFFDFDGNNMTEEMFNTYCYS